MNLITEQDISNLKFYAEGFKQKELNGDAEVLASLANRLESMVVKADSQAVLLAEVISEIEEIDYNYQAEGCGLEDANITDRYEAMQHGWDNAVGRVLEILNNSKQSL